MRWKGRQRSSNVEDRRGARPGLALGGGGGIVVVVILLALKLFNAPPEIQQAANQIAEHVQQQPAPQAGDGIDDDYREFASVVLHDTEQVWSQLFRQYGSGARYQPTKLVLFTGQVDTNCGTGQSAMGPFYCPADQMVYIDPVFFEQLAQRYDAPGDFAQAYVIAHEVAHHVQNQLGYSDIVHRIRQQGDEVAANRASVRLELQADFLAGVWAHHADRQYDILEAGDIREAINAANQIGDDTLQRQATGYVVPERFTHGTSEQRARWFRAGIESGSLESLDQLFKLDYDSL